MPMPTSVARCSFLRPFGLPFWLTFTVFLAADMDAYSRASAAAVSRLPRMSETFLPRRCATMRGLTLRSRASKVARIMLWGLVEPTDLAGSDEHTSDIQSLMGNQYAVFRWQTKMKHKYKYTQ